MKYQPKVTIIIPVYNGSNFMSQAIDCALNQTYKNIEILVVNDGSCDNGESERIALSYGDAITYYHKPNGGVSSVLNFALEKMTGEWFSWLSHDDLYYPEKIEKQIEFLNSLPGGTDLNKTVVHTATESIDKDGNVIKTPGYKDIKVKEDTLETIIGNVYNYRLSGCSFLLPYSCYKDVGGFREDIRTVSDVEFWYRLLFCGYQFYCMKDSILVKNRSHGKQVGKTRVSLFDRELEELHINIADALAKSNLQVSPADMERFYLGLVKRGIKGAAKHTKENYIKGCIGKARYSLVLPVREAYYICLGKGRTLARDVFRKLKVK
ncbi:MAG: glycosyltransferase [Clostridia bacterium]|nr:glycosyltransferase [Clostridia bacterium]